VEPTPSRAPRWWTFEQLHAEADGLRRRLLAFRTALGRFFVGKQELVDLMTVAAVGREPLLMVGPPGTAKRALAVKFKDALGVADEDFFECAVTRSTQPAEIIGEFDFAASVERGGSSRRPPTLPDAKVAFLAEVFQSSSPVLNILLTAINEKRAFRGGLPQPIALDVLFAAATELPERGEAALLRDRFVLRAGSWPVQNESFGPLLAAGLRMEADEGLDRAPWAEGHCTLTDVIKAGCYVAHLLDRRQAAAAEEKRDRCDPLFVEGVFDQFQWLVNTLVREDRIYISDRSLVKICKLLCVRGWLFGDGKVRREDLCLLAYLGETAEEIALLREKVPVLLGVQ
jgi:MoxR-like ATPase